MTPAQEALKEILPRQLGDRLSSIELEKEGGDPTYDEVIKILVDISRMISPREVVRITKINHIRSTSSPTEEAVTEGVALLPLSVQFWAIVTVLVGAISAVLGVCVWQLVLALSNGNWTTAWPVPVWGILLSLCLFLTVAAGVKHRLTNGH